jgi:hypothetical protein
MLNIIWEITYTHTKPQQVYHLSQPNIIERVLVEEILTEFNIWEEVTENKRDLMKELKLLVYQQLYRILSFFLREIWTLTNSYKLTQPSTIN